MTTRLSESLEIPFNALTIGKEIGRGGFGIVYEGSHQYSKVAIKKLLLGELSEAALEEFRNETKIMWNMRSPNIVQLYGSCSSAPPYCMVMELVKGGSLFGFLQKDKSQDISWKLRLSIATDIARGVLALHAHNILHRDLKSLNVLLDEHQTAKLTDFGLSMIKTQTASATKSEAAGTLAWMAPELFQRKAVFTHKSDMYSYGMVLWEIASRDIPFKDAHGNQGLIMQWVSKGEREEIPQGTPQKISTLIEACWKEKLEERPDAKTAVETLLKIDSPPSSKTSEPRYLDNLNSFTSSTPSYLGDLETQPSKMPNTPPAPLKLKPPVLSPEVAKALAVLNPNGAKKLALALEKNSTSLDLAHNDIGPERAKALALVLEKNSTLTSLNLNYTNVDLKGAKDLAVLGPELAKALALALEKNFTLTSLTFSGNKIGPKGAQALALALEKNSTLTSLDLRENSIGPEGATALALALQKNSTLTSMDLSNNKIDPEGAKALALTLQKNSTLTSLDLLGNEIGPEGAKALALALQKNSTLTSLDLPGNDIGPKGAIALASALQKNSTLTFLGLRWNKIGPEGAKALALTLQKNSTLTSLDLSGNKIDPEGAKALALTLQKNSTLTSLDLTGNDIGPEEAIALALALQKNSTLTSLNLSENNIGNEGAKALALALQKNSTLTSLKLYGSKIGSEDKKIIFQKAIDRGVKILF